MVLIADDDRDIVRFVEVNLRLEGFQVVTAHDGEDALDKAFDLQPNLILLDVMMPRMDGYQVCTRLRADGRTAHIPVLMLTARSLSADKVLGLTAGADDYSAGTIVVEDRQGQPRSFPLVSVSVGIASTDRRRFDDHRELVATATELKNLAKRQPRSAWAVDRRSNRRPS